MGRFYMEDYLRYFLFDCDEELPERNIYKDDDAPIARYFSFPKLVYLLTCQELFFCRLDKFNDLYEGNAVFGLESKDQFQKWREWFFVNSWNLYPGVESLPLWKIYLEGNYGVAVISNIKSVFNAIEDQCYEKVSAYPVNYLKEDCPPKVAGQPYVNAITKKEFYLFESEIRFMLRGEEDDGIYIPVNLDSLIQKVVFSPFNPEWVNKSIKKLFNKYFDNTILFEHSKILVKK